MQSTPFTTFKLFLIGLILVVVTLLAAREGSKTFFQERKPQLQKVVESGKLKVLTRFDPTTYYESADGFSGLEHDLVQLFAERLGVEAQFIIPDTFSQILSMISEGQADIAAAGLTVTDQRKTSMRFAPEYTTITEQLVYRARTRRPRKISDLSAGILEVVHGTTHIDSLVRLKKENPELEWDVNSELNTDGLLYLVNEGLIDYTVADSNQITLVRRFYPKLYVAFDLSKPRKLAWAFPKSGDMSLYNEAVRFFEKIKKDKTLDQLIERHYGHATTLGYVDNCTFRKHFANRLPKFRAQFEKAAHKNGMDWRLLAAIGYQESHWRTNAVSPTGVRGIMMLTQATAKQLKVTNRRDPGQSIEGGARYFMRNKKKIPERIDEPDRTWLALAAYNVGFGHLNDARIITQRQSRSPDKWIHVKQSLPLLTQKKWYKQTKHGYARGWEPVRYVENVRGYFDLLVWLTQENIIEKNAMAKHRDTAENKSIFDSFQDNKVLF